MKSKSFKRIWIRLSCSTLTLLALAFSSLQAFADTAQQLEAKGIEAFNSGKVESSELLFKQALRADPNREQSFNYLVNISRTRGDERLALQEYEVQKGLQKAKSGTGLWGKDENPVATPDLLKLKSSFLSTLVQGLIPASNAFFLAYLLAESGNPAASNYFSAQASGDVGSLEPKSKRVVRPMHYFKNLVYEDYEALLIPRRQNYQTVRGNFNTRNLDSASVAQVEARASLFSGLDNNVTRQHKTVTELPRFPQKSGIVNHLNLDLNAQMGDQANFLYGGDLSLSARRSIREDIGEFDQIWTMPSLFVSYWNAKNYEVRLSYDYSMIWKNRNELRPIWQRQGPSLGGTYYTSIGQFFLSGSYLRNFYPKTPVEGPEIETGTEILAHFEYVFGKKKSKIKPLLTYLFDKKDAQGANKAFTHHQLGIGVEATIMPQLTAKFTFERARSTFDLNVDNRKDWQWLARLLSQYAFTPNVTLHLDGSYLDQTSRYEANSFKRWQASIGASYALPIL